MAKLYGELAKGNKSRTGQKASAETCAKQSMVKFGNKNAVGNQNALGHIVSKEQRDALSARMKGKQLRLGAVLSSEAKANISAGRKGKAIGNQNWRKRKSVIAQQVVEN